LEKAKKKFINLLPIYKTAENKVQLNTKTKQNEEFNYFNYSSVVYSHKYC
jgi:hypothetical protein